MKVTRMIVDKGYQLLKEVRTTRYLTAAEHSSLEFAVSPGTLAKMEEEARFEAEIRAKDAYNLSGFAPVRRVASDREAMEYESSVFDIRDKLLDCDLVADGSVPVGEVVIRSIIGRSYTL